MDNGMVRVDFTLDGHSPNDGIEDGKKEAQLRRKLALRVKTRETDFAGNEKVLGCRCESCDGTCLVFITE